MKISKKVELFGVCIHLFDQINYSGHCFFFFFFFFFFAAWHSQYQKVDDYGWRSIGDYDYYSVMHYPIWAPETYKDAFKLPDGIDRNRLGQDDGVTADDVYKIDILYS